jgi:NAD(P)-dependent dehydrogenase (short-subunit alcohol dehydrogenase family)
MNILVTGASRGIGFALVKELLKSEENQVIALSRTTAPLQAFLKENPHLSPRLSIYMFDMADFEPERCVVEWSKHFCHLDILINNAGLLINKPFMDLLDMEWQHIFSVNFFGCVRLIRSVFPLLKKSKKAHIVNIGSMGGHEGTTKFSGLSAYSASKAALANLTECLAEEWKIENIVVNCLMLGAVNTELMAEAFPDYTAPVNANEMARFIVDFSANGRLFFNGKILPVSSSTP